MKELILNIIFPFNDDLLAGYKRRECTSDDKRKLSLCGLFLIGASLLFIFIGEAPALAKTVLIGPTIVLCACAILLLLLSNDGRLLLLGVDLCALSLSSFSLAITMTIGEYILTIPIAIEIMKYAIPAYLMMLLVGYRLHYYYQLKHGTYFEKVPWSNTNTAVVIIAGISISKVLSRSVLLILLLIVTVIVHLMISSVLLDHRKYCRSIELENLKYQGIKRRGCT